MSSNLKFNITLIAFFESNSSNQVYNIDNYYRHAKNEVLQNGRQLAFNLIETIQNEYSATYTHNQVTPQANVTHQQSNIHIQQPQVIHQTAIQTNNGQIQQINPGNC